MLKGELNCQVGFVITCCCNCCIGCTEEVVVHKVIHKVALGKLVVMLYGCTEGGQLVLYCLLLYLEVSLVTFLYC